jgi:hypothetical protein
MYSLAEFQRQFSLSILSGSPSPQLSLELDRTGLQRMAIHRTTVFMTMTNALSITYRSVVALLGRKRFTALAHDYVMHCPPRGALLYDFGATFPEYLKSQSTPTDHPALADLASFDWNIDMVGHRPVNIFGRLIPVSGSVGLRLDTSLSTLNLNHAVAALHDALIAAPNVAGCDLRTSAGECWYIFWRATDGVRVDRISEPSYTFATSLLAGHSAAEALAPALPSSTAHALLRDIQRELFLRPFCQVVTVQPEHS